MSTAVAQLDYVGWLFFVEGLNNIVYIGLALLEHSVPFMRVECEA